MSRHLLTTIMLSFALSGCSFMHVRMSAADLDQAQVDKQLLEAAESIQRAQAELRSIATVPVQSSSGAAPVQRPAITGMDTHTRNITINWQGDAAELVKLLAMNDNRRVEFRGERLPLPVSLNVVNTPYGEMLNLLSSQIQNRAAIYPLPGRLVLEYLPSQGVLQ